MPVKPRHTEFDLAVNEGGGWIVNGTEAEDDVGEYLYDSTSTELEASLASCCPYCDSKLAAQRFEDLDFDTEAYRWNREYLLHWCPRCSYWEMTGGEGSNTCDPGRSLLVRSVAAMYDLRLPDGCTEALAQHLRRHPKSWHELSPTRMETLVAEMFRANYRHAEVIHVGQPGDKGVDVLFVDDESTRWLVQVKRRQRADRSEGFATLQSVLGTLALVGDRHGVIVTTADSFSHQARQSADAALRQGFRVELLDKGKLDRMLGPLLPCAPWRESFERPSLVKLDPDIATHFGIHAQQLEFSLGPSSFRDFVTGALETVRNPPETASDEDAASALAAGLRA